MSNIGVIQIFIKLCDCLIYSFSQKIDFCGYMCRFRHTNLAGTCTLHGWSGDFCLIDQLQIRKLYFGTDNSHLYKQIALTVRTAAYRTFQIHTQNLYCISQRDIFGSQFLLWLLDCSFLGHAFFRFIHTFAQILTLFFHSSQIHMVFLEFVEHFHGLISIFFGFPQYCMGFFICLTDNTVSLIFQFFLFGFHLGFECFYFFFILFNLAALVFDSYTAALQRGKNILKGFVLFTDLLFGFLNNIIRKSQFGGNSKCITFARDTDKQTVGRAKGFYIKFTAGIFYT